MVDPLLNHMPMLRVVGINDEHGLKFPFSTPSIRNLKPGARHQHRKRETLGVHSRLDQFLAGSEIPVPTNKPQAKRHTRNPARRDDRISILPAKVLELLPTRSVFLCHCEGARCRIFVLPELRVAGGLKTTGVDVCADDGCESSRAADEESF